MRPSKLSGAIAFSAAVCLSAPALAGTSLLDFIYVNSQTVETFAVETPPTVISHANGGPLQQTVIQPLVGTLNGQDYAFGDLTLFHRVNFGQSGFQINSFTPVGTTGSPLTIAAGPFDRPLYAGLASAPQILPGVYSMVGVLGSGGGKGTLYIVDPKPVVFTLSGRVNAVIDMSDFPREVQYGSRYTGSGEVQYFQTYPVQGTLNGAAFNFGAIDFYNQTGGFSTQNGGLDFGSFNAELGSPTLFTGDLFAPTFKLGVFQLPGGETLTITAPDGLPAAIPEPSTWAVMMLGLGAVGLALRQRRVALAA